ncbi:hypothetical protein M2132_001926 [Dysgonomonas sp. PH5-45]|uniref:hypothetical protein n=1 Tax=Dysgonomonas sp. PH5-45 TaxID=1742396 RepID=UPI0024745434|nr:hypothetical protein [Dysgonomonas sp. PH5-45]MDH6355581.1 hypothetical protein [Dysgonomonas sp. PH5-45]
MSIWVSLPSDLIVGIVVQPLTVTFRQNSLPSTVTIRDVEVNPAVGIKEYIIANSGSSLPIE